MQDPTGDHLQIFGRQKPFSTEMKPTPIPARHLATHGHFGDLTHLEHRRSDTPSILVRGGGWPESMSSERRYSEPWSNTLSVENGTEGRGCCPLEPEGGEPMDGWWAEVE
jgi:hypothetical protein